MFGLQVFVSIYGNDRDVERGFSNLQKMEGYIRKQVGGFLTIRRTPQIRLVLDDSLERGARILSILQDESVKKSLERQKVRLSHAAFLMCLWYCAFHAFNRSTRL